MRGSPLLAASLLALALPTGAAVAAPTVAEMHGHRRVLLVASPSAADPRLLRQRRALAGWRRGARDRDLALVVVSGSRVSGAADRVPLLRRRWHLPPGEFEVILIGKDGRAALRSSRPLSAPRLQHAIDAMPMRRAGGR